MQCTTDRAGVVDGDGVVSEQLVDVVVAVRHQVGDVHFAILAPAAIDVRRSVACLLYTSPSPRDGLLSRMPSSA